MAKKMNAMAAQLAAAAGRAPAAPAPAPLPKAGSFTPPMASSATTTRPPSREGRVHVGAWLPEAYQRHILLVRAKTGLPVKTIFATALNDLFRTHGVPEIDEE
jgi:hypothetical protein